MSTNTVNCDGKPKAESLQQKDEISLYVTVTKVEKSIRISYAEIKSSIIIIEGYWMLRDVIMVVSQPHLE